MISLLTFFAVFSWCLSLVLLVLVWASMYAEGRAALLVRRCCVYRCGRCCGLGALMPGWYCRTVPGLCPGDRFPVDHPEWFQVVGPFRWYFTAWVWAWLYLTSREYGRVDIAYFPQGKPEVES